MIITTRVSLLRPFLWTELGNICMYIHICTYATHIHECLHLHTHTYSYIFQKPLVSINTSNLIHPIQFILPPPFVICMSLLSHQERWLSTIKHTYSFVYFYKTLKIGSELLCPYLYKNKPTKKSSGLVCCSPSTLIRTKKYLQFNTMFVGYLDQLAFFSSLFSLVLLFI